MRRFVHDWRCDAIRLAARTKLPAILEIAAPSPDRLDRLMHDYISPELIKRESELAFTKHLSYKVLHPVEAFILYARVYFTKCAFLNKEYWSRPYSYMRVRSAIALNNPERIFRELSRGDITALWKGRQAADLIELPYRAYINYAISDAGEGIALGRTWNLQHAPRPNQLYSIDVINLIENTVRDDRRFFGSPRRDYSLLRFSDECGRREISRQWRRYRDETTDVPPAPDGDKPSCFGKFFVEDWFTQGGADYVSCGDCSLRRQCRPLTYENWKSIDDQAERKSERERENAEIERLLSEREFKSGTPAAIKKRRQREREKVRSEGGVHPTYRGGDIEKVDITPSELPPSCILERLHHDPDTGAIHHRNADGTIGAIATFPGPDRYLRVIIDGKPYLAHRIAWVFITGEHPDPKLQINHIDHNPQNNRAANLELVPPVKNAALRKKSGTIYFDKAKGKYRAEITINGNRERKRFTSKAEAETWLESIRPIRPSPGIKRAS